MPFISCYIQIGTECLHYLRGGTGSRLLLAFHGYGHDAQSLTLFAPYLGEEYTCLFFDLPHHGKSNWKPYTIFTPQYLAELVKELMQVNKVAQVSLLGYSIGGRVCLSIVELLPQNIDRVTLLATDGLRIDPYYRFFTRSFTGKKIFNHMLTKPGQYHRMMKLLRNSKVIDESRYKFVMYYLGNETFRAQLLKVWPSLAELVHPPEALKQVINKHSTPITLFMGKYDRVIPPILAENFRAGVESIQVIILEKGHRIFDSTNAQQIAQSLLHSD